MIKFKCSKTEYDLITQICERVSTMAKSMKLDYPMREIQMDITACHCNGNPLDLEKFRDAPKADFGHDAFGIRRYIDRSTGKLTECFSPRCSTRQPIAP